MVDENFNLILIKINFVSKTEFFSSFPRIIIDDVLFTKNFYYTFSGTCKKKTEFKYDEDKVGFFFLQFSLAF